MNINTNLDHMATFLINIFMMNNIFNQSMKRICKMNNVMTFFTLNALIAYC